MKIHYPEPTLKTYKAPKKSKVSIKVESDEVAEATVFDERQVLAKESANVLPFKPNVDKESLPALTKKPIVISVESIRGRRADTSRQAILSNNVLSPYAMTKAVADFKREGFIVGAMVKPNWNLAQFGTIESIREIHLFGHDFTPFQIRWHGGITDWCGRDEIELVRTNPHHGA